MVTTTEFKLAVKSCEWSFGGGSTEILEELCHGADWRLLLRVLRRHRVQALAWNCLSKLDLPVPNGVSDDLRADAAAIATSNLRAAAESVELIAAFQKAQVPLIFVKGLTLGALAYANPFLKMSSDLDVLVPPHSIGVAALTLWSMGYVPSVPTSQSSLSEIIRWHGTRKESAWHKADGNFHLDLHSRLPDNPLLVPSIGMQSPKQAVRILPGIILPTLSSNELFAYLCVHGASSAWFRLKWVTDLAALLHGTNESEIMRLYVASQQLGAGRAAAQALLIADRIYGTLGQTQLHRHLTEVWTNRWLARAALKQLSRLEEPTDACLGTATIHLTQFGLLPGATFKLSELVRQCRAFLSSSEAAPDRG